GAQAARVHQGEVGVAEVLVLGAGQLHVGDEVAHHRLDAAVGAGRGAAAEDVLGDGAQRLGAEDLGLVDRGLHERLDVGVGGEAGDVDQLDRGGRDGAGGVVDGHGDAADLGAVLGGGDHRAGAAAGLGGVEGVGQVGVAGDDGVDVRA